MVQAFPSAGLAKVAGESIGIPEFQVYLCEEGSAIGDPHMGNMDGEKFDINQPGTHMFSRVPQDRGQPALLEMQAMIQRTELTNPCAMYIMEVNLAGHWMGNASSLCIRASQQHPEIKVSAKGAWLPYAEFSKVPMVLSETLEGT